MGRLGQKEHRITNEERAHVTRLRQEGVALKAIAATLALSYSTVRFILAKSGVRASTAVRAANNRDNYARQDRAKLAARGVASWDELMERTAKERGGLHLGKWINSRTPTAFRCARGHDFEVRPNNLLEGQWCKLCVDDARRSTLEDLRALGAARHWKLISTEARGVDTKHEWVCDNGHRVLTTPTALKGGHGCSTCAGNAPITVESLHELAAKKGWKFLDTEARGSQVDHLWQCKKGHTFMKWPNNVRHTGCPVCAAGRHVSKGQQWVFEIVRSTVPSEMEVHLTDRLLIKPFELDVYVPDLKLAIEFDGSYWHLKPKVTERDARKNELCEKKGIALLRVPEESYMTDRHATQRTIEAFIRKALGSSQEELVPADITDG